MWVPQALCPGHSGGSRAVPHPRIWWNIPADCTAAISTFSRLCLGQLQAHERERQAPTLSPNSEDADRSAGRTELLEITSGYSEPVVGCLRSSSEQLP
ncbi:unnamed protein product [Rangifer tarandus platyrhynchus]|uniref:Uncharacterized protein n=2 Tax=Rangifer tarandus platyrhynchus TaxID=3082113 RepID=A0AC59Z9S6_RANTA|nr:unnamed protein product [Rangifer tarandus platyrhynchus]